VLNDVVTDGAALARLNSVHGEDGISVRKHFLVVSLTSNEHLAGFAIEWHVSLCANVRETPKNCLIREEGEKVSMNVDVSKRCGKS